MSIKHAILGLLVDRPLHGYGLKATYEKELVPESTLNIGQIYPALDRLESEGFVTVEVVPQPERPDRKVYTITDSGRSELQNWLRTPAERGAELRNDAFLKLVLASRVNHTAPELSIEPLAVLDAQRQACLQHLHELLATRARAERESPGLASLLLLELGVQRLTAFHQWLDRAETLLRTRSTGSKLP